MKRDFIREWVWCFFFFLQFGKRLILYSGNSYSHVSPLNWLILKRRIYSQYNATIHEDGHKWFILTKFKHIDLFVSLNLL